MVVFIRPSERGTIMTANDSFLRLVLKLDAAACGAIAVGSLLLYRTFDQWFGTPAGLSVPVGVFLAGYAAGLIVLTTRREINPWAVRVVVAGNLAWAVASVVLVLADPVGLTGVGVAFVLAQAAAVVVFAELEFIGLRRAGGAAWQTRAG
jgi:hypothetical protein